MLVSVFDNTRAHVYRVAQATLTNRHEIVLKPAIMVTFFVNFDYKMTTRIY